MAMYLDGVPTFTIMLIGLWYFGAFLIYIPRQEYQFTHNVSRRKLQHDSFFTTPDYTPQVSRHDTQEAAETPVILQQDILVESLHYVSL